MLRQSGGFPERRGQGRRQRQPARAEHCRATRQQRCSRAANRQGGNRPLAAPVTAPLSGITMFWSAASGRPPGKAVEHRKTRSGDEHRGGGHNAATPHLKGGATDSNAPGPHEPWLARTPASWSARPTVRQPRSSGSGGRRPRRCPGIAMFWSAASGRPLGKAPEHRETRSGDNHRGGGPHAATPHPRKRDRPERDRALRALAGQRTGEPTT